MEWFWILFITIGSFHLCCAAFCSCLFWGYVFYWMGSTICQRNTCALCNCDCERKDWIRCDEECPDMWRVSWIGCLVLLVVLVLNPIGFVLLCVTLIALALFVYCMWEVSKSWIRDNENRLENSISLKDDIVAAVPVGNDQLVFAGNTKTVKVFNTKTKAIQHSVDLKERPTMGGYFSWEFDGNRAQIARLSNDYLCFARKRTRYPVDREGFSSIVNYKTNETVKFLSEESKIIKIGSEKVVLVYYKDPIRVSGVDTSRSRTEQFSVEEREKIRSHLISQMESNASVTLVFDVFDLKKKKVVHNFEWDNFCVKIQDKQPNPGEHSFLVFSSLRRQDMLACVEIFPMSKETFVIINLLNDDSSLYFEVREISKSTWKVKTEMEEILSVDSIKKDLYRTAAFHLTPVVFDRKNIVICSNNMILRIDLVNEKICEIRKSFDQNYGVPKKLENGLFAVFQKKEHYRAPTLLIFTSSGKEMCKINAFSSCRFSKLHVLKKRFILGFDGWEVIEKSGKRKGNVFAYDFVKKEKVFKKALVFGRWNFRADPIVLINRNCFAVSKQTYSHCCCGMLEHTQLEVYICDLLEDSSKMVFNSRVYGRLKTKVFAVNSSSIGIINKNKVHIWGISRFKEILLILIYFWNRSKLPIDCLRYVVIPFINKIEW